MKRNVWIWAEKYRPERIDDFVCGPDLKSRVEEWIKDGQCPNLLLAGSAGTGKTTLARIIGRSLEAEVMELNASDERTLEVLRDKVKRFAMTYSERLKVIILDEFDHTYHEFQTAARGVIENLSRNTRFLLTANYLNKIIDPIQSRCKVIRIREMPKVEMAKRIGKILHEEGVKFQAGDVKEIVTSLYPDMRKILNTLQYLSKSGELVMDKDHLVESDKRLKIWELIAKKDIREIRQVVANEPVEILEVYKYLFNMFLDGGEYKFALHVAEHMYRDGFVVDKEINFMACVVGIIKTL